MTQLAKQEEIIYAPASETGITGRMANIPCKLALFPTIPLSSSHKTWIILRKQSTKFTGAVAVLHVQLDSKEPSPISHQGHHLAFNHLLPPFLYIRCIYFFKSQTSACLTKFLEKYINIYIMKLISFD